MDAAGAELIRQRIEQHEHWQQAQAVRDGAQSPVDPDRDELLELGNQTRIYGLQQRHEIVDGRARADDVPGAEAHRRRALGARADRRERPAGGVTVTDRLERGTWIVQAPTYCASGSKSRSIGSRPGCSGRAAGACRPRPRGAAGARLRRSPVRLRAEARGGRRLARAGHVAGLQAPPPGLLGARPDPRARLAKPARSLECGWGSAGF